MKRLGLYLEDNELFRLSAEHKAKRLNLNLKTFSNSKEFMKEINTASKEVVIFLDSDIGEDIKGEQIGKKCFEMGFKNIFLITSYEKVDFPQMPWIKDIGGKNDILKFWNKY